MVVQMEAVSSQMEGVSSEMEGVSSEMDGVSSQMEGVSSQMEGVSSQMEGVSSSQMEGVSSPMEREEMFEAANEEEENKIHPHATLIEEAEETREEKGPELGDGVQTITDEAADMEENSDRMTEPQHALAPREGDEQDNELAAEEGGTQNEASSARQEEKGKGIENAPENVEEGQQGQEEKNVQVKKVKKVKKSRNGSERIQRKLEKINGKIDRILAKKEDYERRLKDAIERERQEAEKGDALQSLRQREEPTAVTEEPTASGSKDVDLVSEGINAPNRERQNHDSSSTKDSNTKSAAGKGLARPLSRSASDKGPPRPLSRTASLVEVSPEELMGEVAAQKRLVESLSKLQTRDAGSETKTSPPTDPSEPILKDKGKGLVVDDSHTTGTL